MKSTCSYNVKTSWTCIMLAVAWKTFVICFGVSVPESNTLERALLSTPGVRLGGHDSAAKATWKLRARRE